MQILYGIKEPKTGGYVTLNEKQTEFRRERKKYLYALHGGGYGSGKTSGNLLCVADDIVDYLKPEYFPRQLDPAFTVLLVHSKIDDAYHALVENGLLSILPRRAEDNGKSVDLVWGLNKKERFFRYGSEEKYVEIYWTGVGKNSIDPLELEKSSRNYDLICMTQLDLMVEACLQACDVRLGRRDLSPIKSQILADSNPCKNFVYLTWVRKMLEEGADPNDYLFINSTTFENPGLAPEYLRKLQAKSKAWQNVYLYANWEFVEGQVFIDFDPALSYVPYAKIPFERSWILFEAMDWGYARDPFFCLWICADHDGNLWFIDEEEDYQLTGHAAADRIMDKRGRTIGDIALRVGNSPDDQRQMFTRLYMPPDMNRTESGVGMTIGDQFYRDPSYPDWRGVTGTMVNPDVSGALAKEQSKLQALAAMFKPDPDHAHPITGKKGSPHAFISDRCPRLLNQIQTAMYDERMRLDKTVERNRFAQDPDATHHFDGLDCALLGTQAFRMIHRPKEPDPPETIFTQRWRKIHGKHTRKATRDVL